jgi:phosphoglycerate dehydrogenase-like enzyme
MKIAAESTVRLSNNHKKRLSKFGQLAIYNFGCSKDEFFETVKDAEIIIGNKWFFNDLLPELKAKLIALWSTGFDLVDVTKCKELGITITNVPAYSTNSVAEQTIALMLELTKRLRYQRDSYGKGNWCYDIEPLTELAGKTIGIIGFGNIGKKIAQITSAMDMKVLVHTRTPKPDQYPNYNFVSLEEALQSSDIVTLHIPSNKDTKSMINKSNLMKMKKTAFLFNCSRGAVIDEKDLIEALKNKTIAGAGLDVFDTEPLPLNNKLTKMENVALTPHTAFWTNEAIERLNEICVDNIKNYLNGKPSNVVNG